jgi:hypothetical protein
MLLNLVHLQLCGFYRYPWAALETSSQKAIYDVLRGPLFRHLSLVQFSIPDVPALENLLVQAPRLKELQLLQVGFKKLRRSDPVPPKLSPTVVLDSLTVDFYQGEAGPFAEALLSQFTRVDIRHLRSLHVYHHTALTPFLEPNLSTLRKVISFIDGVS